MKIRKFYQRTIRLGEKYEFVKIGLELEKEIKEPTTAKEIAKVSRILYRLCKKIVKLEVKEELNGKETDSNGT